MIAVKGAAGNVGGKVADLPLSRSEELRLEHARPFGVLGMRRARVVTGDVANEEDLAAVFDGADAVAADRLVERVNECKFVPGVERMPDNMAPARLGQFLDEALAPAVA